MVTEARRGLADLADYAEEVQGDRTRAARILVRRDELDAFFKAEGLSSIHNPRALIDETRRNAAEARRQKYQDHLAAVAQEAIRVENGEFVHTSLNGVMRAVKAKIADGSDPRLMSGFADKTLAHQVFRSAVTMEGVIKDNARRQPIKDLIGSSSFEQTVPSPAWRQTLQYAGQVLPEGTYVRGLSNLLFSFAAVAKYRSVADRIAVLYP